MEMDKSDFNGPTDSFRGMFILAALSGLLFPPMRVLAQGPALLANADGSVRVEYDLNKGTADFFWLGVKRVSQASADVKLNGTDLKSTAYTQRILSSRSLNEIGRAHV
jgi:hypothetical protein